jgi:hypothetical protein
LSPAATRRAEATSGPIPRRAKRAGWRARAHQRVNLGIQGLNLLGEPGPALRKATQHLVRSPFEIYVEYATALQFADDQWNGPVAQARANHLRRTGDDGVSLICRLRARVHRTAPLDANDPEELHRAILRLRHTQ